MSLPTTWIGLKDVTFTSISSTKLDFDDIVAVDTLPNVANSVTPAIVPNYIVSGLSINTTVQSGNLIDINAGSIQLGSTTVQFSTGSTWQLNTSKLGVTLTEVNGIVTFTFPGDVTFPDSTTISGSEGSSMLTVIS